jgi:hypothetical protein
MTRFWRRIRPRALVLSAAVAVAAVLIGRGATHRRAAEAGAVAEWVRGAVARASEGAGASGAVPMVDDAVVSWVREVERGPRTSQANVFVRAVGAWRAEEGVPASATHVAEVRVRDARATLGIEWPAGGPSGQAQPAIVSFRRTAPRRRAGCRGPGRSPRRRG